MRYIELNPVRAAMVDDPAHYRRTSYRANALGQANVFLTWHPLYLGLGPTDTARQAAYRSPLFHHPLDGDVLATSAWQSTGASKVGCATVYLRTISSRIDRWPVRR